MSGLARYAARPQSSRGRLHEESQSDYRDDYQRDRDRIIHSSAFRRLEYKTQVFLNHEGDMYRTRLTHSIEVAQIGRTIARALSLNEDLTEAICLAHDLGHTPFGHAGQDALNEGMAEFDGFEHNLQSLRIVDVLEEKYARFPGLNLTFETREGVLKHCSRNNAKSLGEIGERFLMKRQPGLEAQIADIADQIAYNNHDVDDGLRSELIGFEQLSECMLFRRHYQDVKQTWPDLSPARIRHEVVRRMINQQVGDLIETSQKNIAESDPADIEAIRASAHPMIGMSDAGHRMNLELKQFLRKNLYRHAHIDAMTERAKKMVKTLFEYYMDHPDRVPKANIDAGNENNTPRRIADYIAGMTDRFAIAQFEKIHSPD